MASGMQSILCPNNMNALLCGNIMAMGVLSAYVVKVTATLFASSFFMDSVLDIMEAIKVREAFPSLLSSRSHFIRTFHHILSGTLGSRMSLSIIVRRNSELNDSYYSMPCTKNRGPPLLLFLHAT